MPDMIDKGITSINYNFLNLPTELQISPDSQSSVSVKYLYRADGVKLRKTNITVAGTTTTENTTDYLDGFQYLNTKVTGRPAGAPEPEVLDTDVAMEPEAFQVTEREGPHGPAENIIVLQFVPTAEGFYSFTENRYIYQYKDHLGNVRVSFAENTETNTLEVVDKNDYYPFGMNHLGTETESFYGQSDYKAYKFGNKEIQEFGFYDYGARFYMPDVGRWGVIDPAADYFPDITPYAYVTNDPIGLVDNDGEMPGPVGAIIGVIADYAMQVGTNYFMDGEDFKTSLTDISYVSLGFSAASGFITGGISSLTKTATSSVGKKIFTKIIDNGLNVLIDTVENVAEDVEGGSDVNIWRALTGGLIEAGIGKFLPLKYVDKLEKKLFKKMNVSATKMQHFKNKIQQDKSKNRSKNTKAKTRKKYENYKNQYESYKSAHDNVKAVNDAYKSGGADVLQNLDLYRNTFEQKKKPVITVGEVEEIKPE
ncbi:MAG: hypothetical protein LBE36_01675 [Flavobacteriaceae bacterium]|nr:hypothetical protein [Flavobacteriaceae bacterium]